MKRKITRNTLSKTRQFKGYKNVEYLIVRLLYFQNINTISLNVYYVNTSPIY